MCLYTWRSEINVMSSSITFHIAISPAQYQTFLKEQDLIFLSSDYMNKDNPFHKLNLTINRATRERMGFPLCSLLV